MTGPLSGAGRVAYAPTTSDAPAGRGGTAFQRAVREVQSLDIPLDGHREAAGERSLLAAASDRQFGAMRNIAHNIDGVLRMANTENFVPTMTALIDKSVTDDLTAKVIGKGISTIDQLTKLS